MRDQKQNALIGEAIHAVSEHMNDLVDDVNVERGDWAERDAAGEQAGGRRVSRKDEAKGEK